MVLYERLWQPVNNKVEARYFSTSFFFGHTTYQNVCSHSVELIKDLISTSLCQILGQVLM